MSEPRLFVEWKAGVVHASVFHSGTAQKRLAGRYETGLCQHTVSVGHWYEAPRGSVVTCFGCIAAEGPR